MTQLSKALLFMCVTAGCAAPIGAQDAYAEWRGYELGATRLPPSGYELVENEDNCRPAPLSECVYRDGGFILAYHDGALISKEANVSNLTVSDSLIESLAAASSKEQVISLLQEIAEDHVPDCYESGVFRKCGVLLSEEPSEYFVVVFSRTWRLVSIRYSVPDAL